MIAPEQIKALVGASAAPMGTLVRRWLRPLLRRGRSLLGPQPNGRRFLLLHVDGISHDTLASAVARGYAPFLGRLLNSPQWRLSPCYAGAPSSTPAFQAGVLYGARHADIPGFWWYDRERRRQVKMDSAADAAEVERQLREHHRGLLELGTANFVLFSGGARANGWCMSGWADEKMRLMQSTDGWDIAASTVAYSLSAARIAGRVITETGDAILDLFRHSNAVGRFQHEPTFLWHRLGIAVGAHEQATLTTIMDMARGVPAIYTVLANYDEIAHRRGPWSEPAMESLRELDASIERIFAAAAALPELNYDIYIASDHGQVPTRPFEALMGLTLRDYLALAEPQAEGPPRIPEEAARRMRRIESFERAAQSLPEAIRCACQPLLLDAAQEALPQHSGRLRLLDEVICIEAGDVAHVYLGRGREPMPLEGIELRYPRILRLLRDCPAIGLVAVRGGRRGFVFRQGKRYDLAERDHVRALGLGYRGELLGEFLSTMLAIRSAGDLVCYGNGLPDGSHVAFCWEFGSHAGVGREEVENFVIHPRAADYDFSRVTHGADLYDFFTSRYMQPVRPRRPPRLRPRAAGGRSVAAWDG